MRIYIKYMVCRRCVIVVEQQLNDLGIKPVSIDLGEIVLANDLTPLLVGLLKTALLQSGLEVIDDRRSILVEKIKTLVIDMIHHSDDPPKTNFSYYLSNELQYSYTYLANLFSEVAGTTIEHFIIKHKIERVKELIIYDELTLTEIAVKLHYSSVAHLSNQFKKITGLTPSFFRSLRQSRRQGIENI